MFSKNLKTIMWVGLGLMALFLVAVIYSMFTRPVAGGGTNSTILLVGMGLLLGAAFMYILFNARKAVNPPATITESSHTVVESMKKVFKIVCAEGYFSEVYDYKDTKKYFTFIPAYKRALVIVKAKVLIGFDFDKFVWETDEENRKIRLVSFPQPELLSLEPDYNYYSIEDEILYKFSNEDFKRIQDNAKHQVQLAAMQSDLPKIASEQMRTMLTEVVQSKNWQLEGQNKLPARDTKLSLPNSKI